jgi:lysophospholipase L1-like esterase
LQGIEFTSDASGVVYNSVGVNGATLSSYLRCELYRKQLQILDPDLIIISIGTNDGYTRRFDQNKFCTEYHELLNETIEAAPDAVLLLTVPNDDLLYRRYSNTNTEKIKNIIQDLAQEYKCGVWDFYTIMGGLNSAQIWYSQKLMQYDRIHFNRKGYQLQGELLFSAFLKAWENHLIEFEHRAYAGIDEMYIPGCIR